MITRNLSRTVVACSWCQQLKSATNACSLFPSTRQMSESAENSSMAQKNAEDLIKLAKIKAAQACVDENVQSNQVKTLKILV